LEKALSLRTDVVQGLTRLLQLLAGASGDAVVVQQPFDLLKQAPCALKVTFRFLLLVFDLLLILVDAALALSIALSTSLKLRSL
jgi:hypothetical protein